MRIQNIGIFMGNAQDGNQSAGMAQVTVTGRKKGGSVFLGDRNSPKDNIEARKRELHKKAMKVLQDAAGSEDKIDEALDEHRNKIKKLQESSQAANEEMNKLDEEMKRLREEHGITQDSQEQKDLDILIKRQNGAGLSEDEKKRLDAMGGLTDYQRTALQYEGLKEEYRDQIKKNQKEIGVESSVIRGTKLERLKSHAMVDAKNSKDEMMKAASKEIIGMLSKDAMDHIAEEFEKEMEEAEKKAEEKEEAEKKLEESRLEREEAQLQLEKDRADSGQELTGQEMSGQAADGQELQAAQAVKTENPTADLRTDITRQQLEAELKKVMQEEKLIEEELKGLALDAKG